MSAFWTVGHQEMQQSAVSNYELDSRLRCAEEPHADPVVPLDALRISQRFVDARGGSSEALGELLENCRNYLLMVANLAIKQGLKAKIGASDLVQETYFEAQRIFHRFEGETEEELLRWLTQILEFKIGTTMNHYFGTAKRDLSRELDWYHLLENSMIGDGPLCHGDSPSSICRDREEWEQYQQAFALLSAEQRRVIELRVTNEMSFEDVGRQMERSAEAVRKLFSRAIVQLQNLLEGIRPEGNRLERDREGIREQSE